MLRMKTPKDGWGKERTEENGKAPTQVELEDSVMVQYSIPKASCRPDRFHSLWTFRCTTDVRTLGK